MSLLLRIVLLLLILPGCFLFPTKDKEGGGTADLSTADLSMPDLSMADLTPEPDLFMPDLFMPDLRPECASESECTGDFAGMACVSQKCTPCSKHADCASQVCDPYQAVKDRMGGPDVPGRCVPMAEVIYVDNKNGMMGCMSGNGTTPATAKCVLQEAIDDLSMTRKAVRIMASTAPYARVTISNKTGTIYGPAGEGGKAQIGNDLNNDAVTVTGTSDVVLYGVEIYRGQNGVECSSMNAGAKLRRVQVTDCNQIGANFSRCRLDIDRSLFTGNKGGALNVARVTGYSITNSIFGGNSAVAASAITFDNMSTGTFRFNTVARNSSTIAGGISCGAVEREIQDTIVFLNSAPTSSQFFGMCKLTGTVIGMADMINQGIKKDPVFMDPMNNDYRLVDNNANLDCCIDKATGTIPIDFFGDRRPKGGGYDIGAHELK